MPQPLAGIRVLDFTHVMAGPFATHLLRLLGAEVIKIEQPSGDLFRGYAAEPDLDGMGAPFFGTNVGKKSVALDLKKPEARAICQRFVETCDVVIENFRPGVMSQFELGYQDCKSINDSIIYCSISGYGQHGPMRDYPAIDNVVQAVSGMMSVSGDEGGAPVRFGVPAVDTYAGTLAALAVLAALVQRGRESRAQFIDVAMMDASLVLLFGAVIPYLVTGREAPRTGNTGFSGQPTAGVFAAADGALISLGVTQQNAFERLCRALGRGDLIDDERFADERARRRNGQALIAILSDLFGRRAGPELETLLSEAGVPCGVIRDVPAAVDLPQIGHREVLLPIGVPGAPAEREVRVLNAGFQFEHGGPGVDVPPPEVGEHTFGELSALGYSEAEIGELNASKVVFVGA